MRKSVEENKKSSKKVVPEKAPERVPERTKLYTIFMIVGGVLGISGIICLLVAIFGIKIDEVHLDFPTIPSNTDRSETYSALTGEALADSSTLNAPTYCVQIPNGTDGARPQAGLDQAGVIFEAIAEAGITRFAAIYQNPTSAVIGPIRSLRIYYLEWDTPFGCTIVHAGGSGDALAAVSSGGYRDLTENYTYMYRGTYRNRLWNNLFTTAEELKQFGKDKGYNDSSIQGFTRMTPEISRKSRIDNLATNKLIITKPTDANTSALEAKVTDIAFNMASTANFNVRYHYDVATNTYKRSYASGTNHEVYHCPSENLGEVNPEDRCELRQLSPNVVIAMMVEEKRASDNYHEDIKAIGSGTAYVFQNGEVVKGKWSKSSAKEQIKFTDESGQEISLAPGQTFITAVPNYGSVDF